ncbi:MAG: oligosaccharide flippase family protein [Acetobacteraceae bacterium]|nr:oligosaccharide flippase family protein [Acetobacteraceae bacterium]
MKTPSQQQYHDHSGSMARNSRLVAICVLVSRITGFGRIAVTAAVLGPTYFGNLFQFATVIPGLIYNLLSGSLISAILIPPLVRCLDRNDQKAAGRVADGLLGSLLAIFLVVIVAGSLGAPILVSAMTSAVQDPQIRHAQLRVGPLLLAMLLPQLVFYAVGSVSIAVQQAHGRFGLPAAGQAVENLATIAVMVVSAAVYGTGTEMRDLSQGQLALLGLGTTAAVALSALLQWLGAWRAGLRPVPVHRWKDPEIQRLLRLGVPSLGYTGLSMLVYFAMLAAAGSVPGGVVAYQITNNLIQFPIALTAGSLAAVQLPQLSRLFDNGQLQEFAATYRSALRVVIFLLLPTSLLLVTIPHSLAEAVAFGAMAGPAGVSLIAACLGGRGLGAVGEAMIVLGTSASYARRDAVYPLVTMTAVAFICGIGIALAQLVEQPSALIWSLGATAAVSNSAAGLYLHCRQLRALPRENGHGLTHFCHEILASGFAMGPAWIVAHYGYAIVALPQQSIWIASAAIIASAGTYMAVQYARGCGEMAFILPASPLFLRRLNNRRKPPGGQLDLHSSGKNSGAFKRRPC